MLNIQANVTCDNSYAIWLGDSNQVHTKVHEEANTTAGQIFQAESLNFSADKGDFLYLLAWGDAGVVQGLIASFSAERVVNTGHPDWCVLPTGVKKGISSFPSQSEIDNALISSSQSDWHPAYVGPTNQNTDQLFLSSSQPINGIPLDAHWVWYDSGNDNSSPSGSYNASPPFKGFDHGEFLIFRIPVNRLAEPDCECHSCIENTEKQEALLKAKALKKSNVIVSDCNPKTSQKPFDIKACHSAELPKDIRPSFYLHWGDSRRDIIEKFDTEIMYLTICNDYANLIFKGIQIKKISICPNSSDEKLSEEIIQIVPNSLICIDCLEGCSCTTRELAFLSRGLRPGTYRIKVDYCIDTVELYNCFNGNCDFKIKVHKA